MTKYTSGTIEEKMCVLAHCCRESAVQSVTAGEAWQSSWCWDCVMETSHTVADQKTEKRWDSSKIASCAYFQHQTPSPKASTAFKIVL